MATTRADLLAGEDYEGWEGFCDTLLNFIKNHWRQSDPMSALTEAQPGMIVSDDDDNKLHHRLGGFGSGSCPAWSGAGEWDEILQEHMSCDAEPVFNSVELGDNAIRTNSRAKAYLSADQLNIPDTTWTLVELDEDVYDSGGNFDTDNHRFVTPVEGIYLITASVLWVGASVTADKAYYSGIFVGGAVKAATAIQASHTGVLSCPCTTIEAIGSGVNIELKAYHNVGAATPDIDGGLVWQTYMAVHLLSI